MGALGRGSATRAARALFLVAVAATVAGLSKLHAAVVAEIPYDYTGSSRFGASLAYVLLLVVVGYGVGLPDLPRTRRSALLAGGAAAGMAALGISTVQLAVGDALLPRFVVFGTAALFVPVAVVTNQVARGGVSRAEQRDRVVVVGEPEDASVLAEELERWALKPAVVAAHVPVGGGAGGRRLVEAVERSRGTVVVLSRAAQVDEHLVAQAATLHEAGVRVRTLSLFYEEWLGKLPVAELERMSLMFDIGELHRARYGRAKRLADVALAVVGLVPLALAVPVVAAANLVGNRGPLLYRQERVGRFGHRFTILKFRTMSPGTGEEAFGAWTAEDDPRITPVGRLLRSTHLDELPQLLNVLRGDLSLVGPRPEQSRYVEELSEKLPFYALRHVVRPGLTGWAQVTYGYAGDEHDALEKLQFEFFYLRHQGLRFDLRILGRTARTVLGREGRAR